MDLFDEKGEKVSDKRVVTAIDNSKKESVAPVSGSMAPTATSTVSPIVPTQVVDQDIKNLLADVQSGVTTNAPVGGIIPTPEELPKVDLDICRGIIEIFYGLPQTLLNFEFQFPEKTIETRAKFLMSVLNQYGFTKYRHLNLIFLALGVGQDMMLMFKAFREAKNIKEREEEIKRKEDEIRNIEYERKKAEALTGLNQKLDSANASNIKREEVTTEV